MALTQQQIDTLKAARDATVDLRNAIFTMEALWAEVEVSIRRAPTAISDWTTLKADFQPDYTTAKGTMTSAITAWQTADQAVVDL